jgi:hypothetical protein
MLFRFDFLPVKFKAPFSYDKAKKDRKLKQKHAQPQSEHLDDHYS